MIWDFFSDVRFLKFCNYLRSVHVQHKTFERDEEKWVDSTDATIYLNTWWIQFIQHYRRFLLIDLLKDIHDFGLLVSTSFETDNFGYFKRYYLVFGWNYVNNSVVQLYFLFYGFWFDLQICFFNFFRSFVGYRRYSDSLVWFWGLRRAVYVKWCSTLILIYRSYLTFSVCSETHFVYT